MNYNIEDSELLEKYGWTEICLSPHEIDHFEGSSARGMAVQYVIDGLREEYMQERIPRQYSQVVFDIESIGEERYKEYYEEFFPRGELFIFLGEVPSAPGHCLLASLKTGLVIGLWHTNNFREATEGEC